MTSAAIVDGLSQEHIWYDRHHYEEAESEFQHFLIRGACATDGACHSAQKSSSAPSQKSSLVNEIAKARQQIQKSLQSDGSELKCEASLVSRIATLESENKQLHRITEDLTVIIKKLENRVSALEIGKSSSPAATSPAAPVPSPAAAISPAATTAVTNGVQDDEDGDEDDFELFGDEEEDNEENERLKQERVKAYEARKSKKPALIAKSNIIYDIKPWDDETDMVEMERLVRTIEMDGLLWGSSKLVPLAYTIKKLQISCVVEDDKVSTDELEERITAFEDYVQSVDIAAFNKI